MLLQPAGSARVCGAVAVLPTADFDNQSMFEGSEVGDLGADWALATEFVSGQAAVAKRRPQTTFGVSQRASEATRRRIAMREH